MSTHFGIEIEVSDIGFEGTGRRFSQNNVMDKLVRKHWKEQVSDDQNINCGIDHCGFEYRTPKMLTSSDNIRKIRKFLDGLQSEVGENIPASQSLFFRDTGMHVHVDVTTLNKAARNNMFKTFFMFEHLLLKCQPICRTNNSWCNSMQTVEKIRDDHENINRLDFSRPRSANNPLSRWCSAVGVCLSDHYPTVEVRYGRSTFKSNDVINWVLLLIMIVENAKHMPEDFKVPFTPAKKISQNSKEDFLSFIENVQLEKRWMKNLRKSVARWVDSKCRTVSVDNG